jgi:hypothetical protein
MFKFTWLLVVIVALCSGCGNESPQVSTPDSDWLAQAMQSPEYRKACDETPGCNVASDPMVDAENVWRVRVTLSGDHRFTIEDPELIPLMKGDGIPLGSLYGEHALIGVDSDGNVLDGQILRFPLNDSEVPDELQHRHLHGSTEVKVAYAFIRALPELTTLEIQDQEGHTHASLPVPDRPDSAKIDQFLPWFGIEQAWAVTRPFTSLPPSCAHIIVLQGEEDRHLAGGIPFGDQVRLTTPGPYQLAAIQAALGRMTPMLCQSIVRIAVGLIPEPDDPKKSAPEGAVNSYGAGDLVLINVSGALSEEHLETMISRRQQLQSTIIHEAAHAAETLLTFESSNPSGYMGVWSFPQRTLADKTVENVRLEVGLPQEWQRMHRSFRRHGWAEHFGNSPFLVADARKNWTPLDYVKGGFMSEYSSSNWAEDIADHVNHAYMAKTVHESYAEHGVSDDLLQDYGCLEMRKHRNKNLPAQYSAVYSKLYFLRDLGLVKREDVEWCTGGNLGLNVDQPGFHIWRDGQKLRSYLNGVKGTLGSLSNNAKVFELEASGEAGFGDGTYPAQLKLRLALSLPTEEFEKVSWPRGIYELGLVGSNNLTLRLDGAKAGNFDVMDGFVLVAEASRERIVGSIAVQRVMRLQAPLPVPEVYNPPLVIRFRIDQSGS